MFFRVLCLLTITTYLQVQCYVPVPKLYKKAEVALRRYSSNTNHDVIIFSLLNVLVYDKRASAFIKTEAIDKALEDVKKYNVRDATTLRRFIYGKENLLKDNQLTADLKEDVLSALNVFSSHPNTDDYQTFDLLSKTKKF
ncbi:unnamed protein product [Adineta steineri]|uniref:Uncharacterized protein n=1 Tax=Adineta steineri TaxID=433720 RepID=A0A814VIV5_9BILA|nr:unnamed protein product [Adineta steineri]CAF4247705.1 unnamed protein product [Adineta steineri]